LLALKRALYDAVAATAPENELAVAFSGGVDSSILAKICHDLGKKVKLITVGFASSQDIGFSRVVAAKMGMEQEISEISYHDFQDSLQRVQQIIKCENTSHIENCIAYYFISTFARQRGMNIVLSANGCDELFCGYDGYRHVYNGGKAAIVKLMEEKIANELALVEEISAVAGEFGVQVRQPFLSGRFVEFAKSVPVEDKIKGPDDKLRKHVLRQVAVSIGVPEESAMKPKKALQYGSLIHKYFKQAVKRRGKVL
jgi:asparagine synthase (glutamine-hydrolysing)